ncbi:MAG: M20/M25/M40 family metallo-hydrolase [Planctomycetota bacterium]|nr:MAG: M20/M25/M40 family metallo-hydrolase [Planctomycetota bacterium]
MRRPLLLPAVASTALASVAIAHEPVDLDAITRIRDQGFNHSEVMDYVWHISDRLGPRLTGSPQLKKAQEWARDTLTEIGLKNARLEPWGEFGRGWSFEKVMVEMTEPVYMPIIAIPEAWTPGTDGVVEGAPVLLDFDSVEDVEAYDGDLAGKIVLMGDEADVETPFDPIAERHDAESLEELFTAPEPRGAAGGDFAQRFRDFQRRRAVQRAVTKRLREEGAAAILKTSTSRGSYGVFFVGSGGSRDVDADPALPSIVIAPEHYNRIVRLLEHDEKVTVRVEVRATFHDEDLTGRNVIAEIPGTDPELKDEVVMLGGHYDSWHAGTGATDNGASCAVAMEAARILIDAGLKPRRTIRVALWSGEEQGLLGSRGYVKNHFADPNDMETTEEWDDFAAYFNMDNGGGRFRGIYCQSNAAVRPIFEAWMAPLADLGMTTATIRNTGGTDHLAFDAVGLPGFQFIQDRLDYFTRTHHTNMDVYERVIPADVMQAAVVMATFVYHAANRDEKLPRKPAPEARGRDDDD